MCVRVCVCVCIRTRTLWSSSARALDENVTIMSLPHVRPPFSRSAAATWQRPRAPVRCFAGHFRTSSDSRLDRVGCCHAHSNCIAATCSYAHAHTAKRDTRARFNHFSAQKYRHTYARDAHTRIRSALIENPLCSCTPPNISLSLSLSSLSFTVFHSPSLAHLTDYHTAPTRG